MNIPVYSLNPDIVVFDVDGVLVDTSRSYPEVVAKSLRWAWSELLGRNVDCDGFTDLHFAATKTHPAFNDDFDIAWAIINCTASSQSSLLSRSLPSPEEWRELLEGCTENDVPAWVMRTFGERIGRDVVRRACEEFYFGSEALERLGERVAYAPPVKGLWENEHPLVSISWRDIALPAGIYTGRPLKELRLALKLVGWEDFPPSMIVTPDSGISKPSPLGLKLLCEKADASFPLFLGDAESDRQTVRNFGSGAFAAIGDFLPDAEHRFKTPDEALRHFGLLRTRNE
jgi:phosphoglycolate phosphatase-like HAD superfamily hydrolase